MAAVEQDVLAAAGPDEVGCLDQRAVVVGAVQDLDGRPDLGDPVTCDLLEHEGGRPDGGHRVIARPAVANRVAVDFVDYPPRSVRRVLESGRVDRPAQAVVTVPRLAARGPRPENVARRRHAQAVSGRVVELGRVVHYVGSVVHLADVGGPDVLSVCPCAGVREEVLVQ